MSANNLAEVVADHCDRHPDLEVLTFIDIQSDDEFSAECRSYEQLWRHGQAIGGGLAEEGMKPGDSFAIVMQNHPEFPDFMVAASIEALVFVPIDPRLDASSMQHMLALSHCRGAVVADYALPEFFKACKNLNACEWLWVLDTGAGATGTPNSVMRIRNVIDVLAADVSASGSIKASNAGDPMQMLFTSGTTGRPKAILSPHERFLAVSSLGEQIGFRPDDRPYTGLSLTHSNAQFLTLGTALFFGMPGFISRRFTRSSLWDICRQYHCTVFNLLGGMVTSLMAVPRSSKDADNPVRQVLSAGMPATLWDEFRQRFDVEIFEFYGTAEGGMLINPPGSGPIGSVGKPPEGMLAEVLDEYDRPCEPNVRGQICFRDDKGDALPVSYFNNVAASSEKVKGNWFRSGDIGHKDADGWFYFDYRDGGSVRKNGEFLDLTAIQKVIAVNDMVRDAYVFGFETERAVPGEKELVAAIELESDGSASAVAGFLRDSLPGNHVPDILLIVEKIPKTASEKPQERLLIECLRSGSPTNIHRLYEAP